jgi:hypothetical protein
VECKVKSAQPASQPRRVGPGFFGGELGGNTEDTGFSVALGRRDNTSCTCNIDEMWHVMIEYLLVISHSRTQSTGQETNLEAVDGNVGKIISSRGSFWKTSPRQLKQRDTPLRKYTTYVETKGKSFIYAPTQIRNICPPTPIFRSVPFPLLAHHSPILISTRLHSLPQPQEISPPPSPSHSDHSR